MKCTHCGSININLGERGRTQSCPGLCDACYWRGKYLYLEKRLEKVIDSITVKDDHEPTN
jgi:hypothetical protein